MIQTLETIQRLLTEALASVLNRLQLFATSRYLMRTIGSIRKTTILILHILEPGHLLIFRIGVEIPGHIRGSE